MPAENLPTFLEGSGLTKAWEDFQRYGVNGPPVGTKVRLAKPIPGFRPGAIFFVTGDMTNAAGDVCIVIAQTPFPDGGLAINQKSWWMTFVVA